MKAIREEVGWELLNEQQRKFAEEFVKTHNYTKALTAGGYAFDVNSSGVHGNRLARRCARYIKYLEAHALRQAHISIAAVQHEYARLGFSNLLNYYVRDPVTGKKRAKTVDELTRDEAAAIKEFSFVTIKNDDGTETVVLGDIKLHDKNAALRDLGKTVGAFPGNPAAPVPPPTGGEVGRGIDFTRLPPDELRLLDALFKKAGLLMNAARNAQAITPGADAGHDLVGQASPATVPRLPSGSTKG